MWCGWIEPEITALADAELPAWRAALVRRHLRSCAACAERQTEVERSVAAQRRALPQVLHGVCPPADLMLAEVHRRLRRAEPEPQVRRVSAMRPRLVWASAAGVIVFVLALRLLNPVWIVLGIESPPPVLEEQPDLFRDYQLFEHLDAIENLDRIPQGEGPDSGSQRG
jgi:anti-sigma factor RsiW